MPRIDFSPLTEFTLNQVQSLIENMMNRVAATVDLGGRVIWEKSGDSSDLAGAPVVGCRLWGLTESDMTEVI